jgi:hypothetical protein
MSRLLSRFSINIQVGLIGAVALLGFVLIGVLFLGRRLSAIRCSRRTGLGDGRPRGDKANHQRSAATPRV